MLHETRQAPEMYDFGRGNFNVTGHTSHLTLILENYDMPV